MPAEATGIAISAKTIFIAIGSFLGTAWAGWKLFFSVKIEQLDTLIESHNRLSAKMDEHIRDEEKEFTKIGGSIDTVHERLDELLLFLAKK